MRVDQSETEREINIFSPVRVRGSTRTFHWCGAVIISSTHLLTAAHCLEDYPKESYVVRVGDWDQDVEDVDEQESSIAAVHFHPEYNVGAYLNNDLAVVRLKDSVRLTSRVVPACLPSPTSSYSPPPPTPELQTSTVLSS